ncbi:Uncharacterised protein [uncultured archaeon]|nr:Uncharacterised protein [uncultured archaeon]
MVVLRSAVEINNIMNMLHRELIEHIKKYGGDIVVTPFGLYSMGGTFLGFSSWKTSHRLKNTRNAFLAKYCISFSDEEVIKMQQHKLKHLERYKQQIINATSQNKFNTIGKLASAAESLYEILMEKNDMYERYFHLREDISE